MGFCDRLLVMKPIKIKFQICPLLNFLMFMLMFFMLK